MRNIGVFWGIMGVILTLASIMRFVVVELYNIFIKGLSKRSHRKLIEETMMLLKILEDDHGVFAVGSFISIGFHVIIMVSYNGVQFFSAVLGIVFTMVLITGIIYRFIYKDKDGQIKKYHVICAGFYVIFLIFHIKFN